MVLIAFTLSLYIGSYSPKLRGVLFFFIFIVIVHIISYRKPFVLIAPFILLYSITSVYRLRKSYAVAISVALSLGAYFLPNSVLKFHDRYVVKYPAEPMLQSDIFIAGCLANDLSAMHRLNDALLHSEIHDNRNYRLIGAQQAKFGISNEEEWSILKNAWLSEWMRHPQEMILARCIQIVQFLNGGEFPSTFVEGVRKNRPWLPQIGNVNHVFKWPAGSWPTRNLSHIMAWIVICTMISSIVLSVCAFILCKQSRNRTLFLYIASIVIMGTVAYTSICVPTADFRYKITPFFFAVLSVIYSGNCIIKHRKRIKCDLL